MLESAYYTEDVIALLGALDDIDDADTNNVFMWGHSMGGEVTLRSLLTTGSVRAASLWSSVGGDIWDQAYYYSRYEAPLEADGSDRPKAVIERLRAQIDSLSAPFDTRAVEPLAYLDDLQTPLIIHHAIGDRGAAYKWSERLAKELAQRDKPYRFFSYSGEAHLLRGEQHADAVSRDVAFFRAHQR